MHYRILNGRLQTRSLEVHITDHCNLKCRQCCSLSPFLPPYCVDPDDLRRDLALARRVLAPGIFKLVGGEPLLHPRLLDCLRIVRESGIAPLVSVTTNGLLLGKMPDEFWKLLDALTLSVYPHPSLPDDLREHIRQRTEAHAVALNVKVQDRFQHMTLDAPGLTPKRPTPSFGPAGSAKAATCSATAGSSFALAPRISTPSTTRGPSPSGTASASTTAPTSPTGCAYLQTDTPLKSCERCMGGTGSLFPHRQLTRLEVLTRREGPA